MDAIRVPKVTDVSCSKSGSTSYGTLHLTTHHMIFVYDDTSKEEMWVPYPLISLVTRLPQTLSGLYPLTTRTRTFETFSLSFKVLQESIDVFESVKELTVVTSISQLYAFYYTPNPPFTETNGWSIYNPKDEFIRMGVGSRTKAWRFTDLNKDYSFSPTYPARMVVPTRISDATLQYAGKYRSKCRIPVLTYLHWSNYGSITRSSQPMVGLTANRSIQDEKLIEAIFQTHHSPDSRAAVIPVYGATTTNLIIDARPTTNAMANTAKGAGTENMDHYKDAKKAYLGIDHIHTMREALAKVVEALRETEMAAATVSNSVPGENTSVPILDRQALRRSGWLRHIATVLEGTILIVKNVHINSSHVLIHCSDGWDRTAQLSSLSQLCLDPFYRTMRGFQILVEKDWVSFGHKFLDRCGHLSSEKFFLAPVDNLSNPSGAEAAQAFFASVQNRFASQSHIKETSPIFHQFLECVRQIQRQFPERFEFNERFLRKLHYHLYSCQFGTFLCNTERERRVGDGGRPPCEVTISVWDLFNSPPEKELNLNPDYDPSLDDPASRRPKADQGVLIPNPKSVRFWNELYGRTDEEMNGKFVVKQVAQDPEVVAPAEGALDDAASTSLALPPSIPLPPSPSPSPAPGSPSSASRLATLRAGSPSPTPISVSASAPALTQHSRHDSLRPFDTDDEGSSFTMKTQGPGWSAQSISPTRSVSMRASPAPRAATPQPGGELLAGGMKSMWGKLSSNASAAFSVVQDVYGGVSKDFKGLSISGPSAQTGQGGELRSREELGGTWSSENRPGSHTASPTSYTVGSTNPWSTSPSRPNMPSMFLDNPWNTTRAPTSPVQQQQPSPTRVESLFEPSSGLPADPSVALPAAAISRPPPRTADSFPADTGPKPAEPTPPASNTDTTTSATSDANLDPLGVGVWT
ncbi:hypothetical protein QCA50_003411 [Cerrena zonata]|uniref:Myotubularin phosphatase domain-containing protein n=1 Tax=Cerrena zonata TaxID=2478898 RepID=A0AAW0GPT5_9APHY